MTVPSLPTPAIPPAYLSAPEVLVSLLSEMLPELEQLTIVASLAVADMPPICPALLLSAKPVIFTDV